MKGNNSQIKFYSLPDPIQAVNGINTPSLIGQALIPVDLSKDFTTYTQMNKDIIEEVQREKRKNNQNNLNNRILTLNEINQIYKKNKKKCDLHFEKLSEKCRKCKIIIEEIKNEENKKMINLSYFQKKENPNLKNQNTKKKNHKEYFLQNSSNGKLNNLLLNNILSCQYFKEVVLFKDFQSLEKEIINNVTNIEAWAVGISGVPSTFFCCLYRLFTLQISNEQISHLLKSEFIYVKLIGILYLRFLGEANYLWEYLSPFLSDKTLFYPKVDKKNKITVSEYVQQLFVDEKHYGTRLPRIPVKIERDIKIKLMCYKEMEEREKENMKIIDKFNLGDCVKIYNEKNQTEEGIIKSIKQDGMKFSYEIDVNGKNKFVSLGSIEYIEKRNNNNKKEIVEEGEIIEEKKERSSSNESNNSYTYSHHKHKYYHSKYSRSRSREKNNKINNYNNTYNNKNDEPSLLKQVLESERNTVLAHGKDYAIKPTSFKKSISMKIPGGVKKKFFDNNVKSKEIKVEYNNHREGSKHKNYSEEFMKRTHNLKVNYMSNNKFNDIVSNNKSDSLGPDIMKLE